jgi:ribonuclease-3
VPRFTQAKYDRLAERLCVNFEDRALIRLALTHASGTTRKTDYERLEFLGDRVLGLVIAEELFRRHPSHQEGLLAPRLSQLVRREICAEAAKSIGLQEFILLGRKEAAFKVNENLTVLGDAMEAVIAAIYLDRGLEAARSVILRVWEPFLANNSLADKDAKTFLQEWALGQSLAIPHYAVKQREGPDHAPKFVIEVRIPGREPACGEGTSKRLAEQAAATAFLVRENLRA